MDKVWSFTKNIFEILIYIITYNYNLKNLFNSFFFLIIGGVYKKTEIPDFGKSHHIYILNSLEYLVQPFFFTFKFTL